MKLKNALVATLMAASVFTLAPMDMSAVAATTQNVKAEKTERLYPRYRRHDRRFCREQHADDGL